MRVLYLVVLVTGVAWYSLQSPARATGLAVPAGIEAPSILLERVATRCVRLLRRGNSETLVNTCGTCKIVGITRKRRGVAVPIRRSFNMLAGTSLALPFRGPGSSRITSSHSCQDEAADQRDIDKARTASNSCLALKQTTAGKVVLVNSCSTCRGAALQRMDRNGRALNRQALRLKPNGEVPVVSQGAAKVSIIADFACPS